MTDGPGSGTPSALITWLREQLEVDLQAAEMVRYLGLELPVPPAADGPTPVFMSPEQYVNATGVLSDHRIRANADAVLRIVDRHAHCGTGTGTGTGHCDGAARGRQPGDGTPGCPDLLDVAAMFAARPGYRSAVENLTPDPGLRW